MRWLAYGLVAAARPTPAGAAVSFRIRAAARRASARMVSVGATLCPVGKTEELATNRFAVPKTLQSESTTPLAGVAPIRVAPIG
jgi:hypothetical protein